MLSPRRREVVTYDVVWTGTMEMARRRAERAALLEGSWRTKHPDLRGVDLVLAFIELHPGVTLQRLVEETRLTRPTVTAAIKMLIGRGTVSQERRFGALTWRVTQ